MGSGPRIAIDAMGGDSGPAVMIAGAAESYRRRDDLSFLLFGDEAAIRAELNRHPGLADACEIVHCTDVISGEDKPSQAIRRAKTSSMGLAIAAVKDGAARASRRFAVRGRPLEDQFTGLPHTLGPLTGAAVLDGALASLECRSVSTTDAGDHTVVIGEVLGLGVPDPDGDPLLYYEGRYRAFRD